MVDEQIVYINNHPRRARGTKLGKYANRVTALIVTVAVGLCYGLSQLEGFQNGKVKQILTEETINQRSTLMESSLALKALLSYKERNKEIAERLKNTSDLKRNL